MRRSALVSLLRDRSRWPAGFEWNFHSRCQCAIGLSEEVGIIDTHSGFATEQFGVNYHPHDIFAQGAYNPIPDSEVTPEMVADRLASVK